MSSIHGHQPHKRGRDELPASAKKKKELPRYEKEWFEPLQGSKGPLVITNSQVKSADDLVNKLLSAISKKQSEKQDKSQFVGIFQEKPGELIVEVVTPGNISGIKKIDPQNVLKVAEEIFGKQWNNAQDTLRIISQNVVNKANMKLLHAQIQKEVSGCLDHFQVAQRPCIEKTPQKTQDKATEFS